MTPERQALIDMVPMLEKLEDGVCTSYPYEACGGECESLGRDALEIALDALSPYPGKDRWSEPAASPEVKPTGAEAPKCRAAGAPSVPGTCFKCGVALEPSPCHCGGSHTGTYCWPCHHKNVRECAAPHCPEHGAAAAQAWLDEHATAPYPGPVGGSCRCGRFLWALGAPSFTDKDGMEHTRDVCVMPAPAPASEARCEECGCVCHIQPPGWLPSDVYHPHDCCDRPMQKGTGGAREGTP